MTKSDEKERRAVRNTLESCGLSEQQSAVYIALLQHGPCSAGPLVTHSRLHRERVYRALEALEAEGLVVRSLRNNRQRFQAEHPEALFNQQSKRCRAIQAALPYLSGLMPGGGRDLQVRVFSGADEYGQSLLAAAESAAGCDRKVRIIGAPAAGEFYARAGKRYGNYLRACVKLRIRTQLLLPAAPAASVALRFGPEEGTKVRVLSGGLSAPCATRIAGEVVAFEIFGEEPTALQVHHPAFAESYSEYFGTLWRAAARIGSLGPQDGTE